MNLKDLKYLVALADTGHFGKAAERTFVSQPTLSAQLKKLEDFLGVKLVERQPKNVQLTEVGKQVVVPARRMLDEGNEIEFEIVVPEEVDAAINKISLSSPIGRAMIGKAEGDDFEAHTPKGKRSYLVRKLVTIHFLLESQNGGGKD